MPSTRDNRRRIKSVKNTRQITQTAGLVVHSRMNFEGLVSNISHAHEALQRYAAKSVKNGILRTVSAKLPGKSPGKTHGDGFLKKTGNKNIDEPLPPELLLAQLSFSHFLELMRVEDALQRLFYEVETIKNNWSVRELKRAIGTSLAFRSARKLHKKGACAISQ